VLGAPDSTWQRFDYSGDVGLGKRPDELIGALPNAMCKRLLGDPGML